MTGCGRFPYRGFTTGAAGGAALVTNVQVATGHRSPAINPKLPRPRRGDAGSPRSGQTWRRRAGEILESNPLRRMVIRWQNEWKPELKTEGPSRCTFELEPVDSAVKLTITHEIDRPESGLITAVSGGWPLVLSNLKSLLETGEVAITRHPSH